MGALRHLTKDWTQNNDLAAKNPEKVKELEAIWWREAEKYNVLPLDASVVDAASWRRARRHRRPDRVQLPAPR